jgi:hypothetical protein
MSGPGNGNGGNFGGGGGTPDFDCANVSIKTNVISPEHIVLDTVNVGDDLNISLQTATGPLLAKTKKGKILGSVFTKDPALLIKCINDGYTFKAAILKISGGDVQILITNQ